MALNIGMLLHQIVYISAGNCRGNFFHVNIPSSEDIMNLGSLVQSYRAGVATGAGGPVHEAGHQ